MYGFIQDAVSDSIGDYLIATEYYQENEFNIEERIFSLQVAVECAKELHSELVKLNNNQGE